MTGMDEDLADYVEAWWPRLVRAAVLLGSSPPEAEDLVQGVFERCVQRWNRVRRAEDRDAYVHRMLVNAFVSSRRRRWTHEVPTAALTTEEPGPDATVEVDDADVMERALNELSADHRAVVVLRYYTQLNEQQMATALGIAPGTVKSRLARALQVLAADPQLNDLRGIQ
jgi:RNA polymerase sigma-70 factor (sigma-E family)